jgi:hypothetical protein
MRRVGAGSKFDDFLREERLFKEVSAAAVKRVIAFQVQSLMRKKHLTKKEMTLCMGIKGRMQLDRLLDPDNVSVTLLTLERTAKALGKKLEIAFV